MASKTSKKLPRTAAQTAAKCLLVLLKLGAIACILTLFICGTRLLRGSHGGRDDLFGKSFSMVSFTGIAAKSAGNTPPYLVSMHWFLNSFGWEWLEPSTEINAANYVYIQPVRPLHMPDVMHDVTNHLYRAGHMMNTCKTGAESCIRASKAFFAAFDSAGSLTLHPGPAFALYMTALVFNVCSPALFACLAFFRDRGVTGRWLWFKAGVLALPAAFHVAAASLLTYNAVALVKFLTRFPDLPTEAAVGVRFLVVAWCGVLAELLASLVTVVRVVMYKRQIEERRKSQASRRSARSSARYSGTGKDVIPIESRMKAEDV
ncbi:hypothetical protein CSOJ01_06947 [Colletotrichum sojae]|uniref:Uncharacterized protein n=1 Tax=Colletotrichum sojae TaxID=2175907 RepID=A0A8H6MUB8_9PEZI|nr:hypothetical protein CSOJ01_06947 [Colletotrichum sojae]